MPVNPSIPTSNFQINSKIESITLLGEGNIHETFFVKTKGNDSFDYLLQHKNKIVFKDVPSMMRNISRVCVHLKDKIERKGLDPLRYTLTLIPTHTGELYYVDDEGEFWAMCLYIKDSVTYHNPLHSTMAMAGGRGTGEFHNLLSDFTGALTDILPGYHNMRFRYEQWDTVMGNISDRKQEGGDDEIPDTLRKRQNPSKGCS
jgi:hypothetical protein